MEQIIENRFRDKVMVVTGCAGGIGKEIAIRASKEGAKLVLADQKEEMSKQTIEELKNITDDFEFLICDLTQRENCEKLINIAISRFKKIDILINNAGITGIPAPVHLMDETMFRKVIECNIMIAYYCSHFGLKEMIKNKDGGSIVNVASVAGMVGFPGHSAYVTSKHGLNGLTKNMALDYASYGIRVNSVNPGTTDTPMYREALEFLQHKKEKAKEMGNETEGEISTGKFLSAQKRVASAKEVSDVILYLSSDEASNITGAIIPVDGGFTTF